MGELAGEGLGGPGVTIFYFIFFGSGASIHKDGESQRFPCAGFINVYEIWSSVK